MDKVDQQMIEDLPQGKKEPGMNVVHITRVTGYFAYTEHFNKGKAQELKDRHRNNLANNEVSLFGWYNPSS